MHWKGLYPIIAGLIIGSYGLLASRSAEERSRNRRSLSLIPNLLSRLPGNGMAIGYLLVAGFFVIGGIVVLFIGPWG